MKLTSSGVSTGRSAMKALLLCLVKHPKWSGRAGCKGNCTECRYQRGGCGNYGREWPLPAGQSGFVSMWRKSRQKASARAPRPPSGRPHGDTFRVDATLALGQVSESVTVRAAAIEVNTEDAQ